MRHTSAITPGLAPSPYAGRPNTATHEITYRDEPEPAIDAGDVLIGIDAVGIDAVGICGSDMHAYHGHELRP